MMGRHFCNFPMYSEHVPGPYYIVAGNHQHFETVARDLRLNPGDRRTVRPLVEERDWFSIGDVDIIQAENWQELGPYQRNSVTRGCLAQHVAKYMRDFSWYVGDMPEWFKALDHTPGLAQFVSFETRNNNTGELVQIQFTMDYVRNGPLSDPITERSLHRDTYADNSSRWLNPTAPLHTERVWT